MKLSIGCNSKMPILNGQTMSRLLWKTLQEGSDMSFKRCVKLTEELTGQPLTAAMIGIGMNFADKGMDNPNIEDTLLAASKEALEKDDLRVLAVLVKWLSVHSAWINADRMIRIISEEESIRVKAFWSGVGYWLKQDRRFARIKTIYQGPSIGLLKTGNDFQTKRHGEDARFAGGPFRVPANVLRDRESDVLSPGMLAKQHRAYCYRVMIGPSYRADMWATLEANPTVSIADLARQTYGSFATAWQVKRDWSLIGQHIQSRRGKSNRGKKMELP